MAVGYEAFDVQGLCGDPFSEIQGCFERISRCAQYFVIHTGDSLPFGLQGTGGSPRIELDPQGLEL